MRIFSSGLQAMPCGCDITEAKVSEKGELLLGVIGVDTELGVVWEHRQDESELAKARLAQLNARPGYPIINGVYIADERGEAKVFVRRGTFTVACDVHGENPGPPQPLALAQLDLNEKAREALKRRFNVGRVYAGTCAPGDEPFIGARAADLEFSDTTIEPCIRALAGELNRLADRNLICGTRSGPDVFRRRDRDGVIVDGIAMRVMLSPAAKLLPTGREDA